MSRVLQVVNKSDLQSKTPSIVTQNRDKTYNVTFEACRFQGFEAMLSISSGVSEDATACIFREEKNTFLTSIFRKCLPLKHRKLSTRQQGVTS
jgi:hypothetical protein